MVEVAEGHHADDEKRPCAPPGARSEIVWVLGVKLAVVSISNSEDVGREGISICKCFFFS